jgi:hypothetical protein
MTLLPPTHPFADSVPPVLPVASPDFQYPTQYHTPDKPFCPEPACTCHEDPDAIAQVNEYVYEGLMTPDDATRFVQGKTV